MLKRIGAEESGEFKAVASGTLPSGKPVVVNADGTVSVISKTSASESVGTPVNITGTETIRAAVAYDANAQKVVIAYRDSGNGNAGTAIVGTISGTSISFGSATQFLANYTDLVDIVYDTTAQKVVIAYQNVNNGYGYGVVGTVSGTSISFGTPVIFKTAALQNLTRIAYHSAKNRVGIIYKNSSASDNGEIVIGEVSGTSLTFGSSVTFESGLFNDGDIVYDASAERFVTAHKDENTSNNGFCCVISVGGTGDLVPTVNTRQSFNGSSAATRISAVYDSSNQKVVISFADGADGNKGTAIVATIGSTSATFGTKVQFTSSNVSDAVTSITYDSGAGKVVISYRDRANSDRGTIVSGTVSGTSISFDTPAVFDTNTVDQIHNAYDANAGKVVTVFVDVDTVEGQAFVFQTGYTATTLTSENYIGVSTGGAVADTKGATIGTKGSVAEIVQAPYDIVNSTYNSVSLDVSGQGSSPTDIDISPDGTRLFVLDNNQDDVNQYNLSTAFDLSTATYSGYFHYVRSQESSPNGLTFNPSGTIMVIVGSSGDEINRYSLSTGFDLNSTIALLDTTSVSSQTENPQGIRFNNDGSKVFVAANDNDEIYEYDLSTAYDTSASSLSYNNVALSGSGTFSVPLGLTFNDDGTKLFVVDGGLEGLFQYNLSTAFDLSSASYSGISKDFLTQVSDNAITGAVFSADGTKLYATGGATDSVYEFDTPSSLTAGQSVYVTSDGSFSLTADSPSVLAGTTISATKLLVKT